MPYNLLEIVQLTLSSLDSDEVNTINDTVESRQIVDIARSVFDDMVSRYDMPENNDIFELEASGDNTKPVLMFVPDNVLRIDWVRYNKKETTDTFSNYQRLEFKPLDTFLQIQNDLLRNETSNVAQMTHTINGTTFDFLYRTDRQPEFYTSFDDKTLIFNAIDLTEDTTLQKDKTQCSGWIKPVFQISNSFIPTFDEPLHTLWLSEVKAQAFVELKQTQNAQVERKARRQEVRFQKDKRRVPFTDRGELDLLPNYGRK